MIDTPPTREEIVADATDPNNIDGYHWFRHHRDATVFIAFRDTESQLWFMCGVGHPIHDPALYATYLGMVPRTVVGGGSIDQ